MHSLWASGGWPVAVAGAVAVVMCSVPAVRAQKSAPVPAAAAGAARQVAAAMEAAKLDAFAVRDPSKPGRFISVRYIPKMQLNLAAATYERASDIDYFIYQKDYASAYSNLYSGVMASDRVLIEDMLCDGLVVIPAKGQVLSDSVTILSETHVFDGDIADPKKKNDKRISRDEYMKVFSAADQEYQHLLSVLLSGLHKSESVLGTVARVR